MYFFIYLHNKGVVLILIIKFINHNYEGVAISRIWDDNNSF